VRNIIIQSAVLSISKWHEYVSVTFVLRSDACVVSRLAPRYRIVVGIVVEQKDKEQCPLTVLCNQTSDNCTGPPSLPRVITSREHT
jgi:hypothetical protein